MKIHDGRLVPRVASAELNCWARMRDGGQVGDEEDEAMGGGGGDSAGAGEGDGV